MSLKQLKIIEKHPKAKKVNLKEENLKHQNKTLLKEIIKTRKAWLLLKSLNQKVSNMIKKVKYQVLQEVPKLLNQAQWLRSLFIKFKETMMMNGPLLLNLILNFSKNKSSLKEWENKNLKRKLKSSLINKWRKKEEKKKEKKKN